MEVSDANALLDVATHASYPKDPAVLKKVSSVNLVYILFFVRRPELVSCTASLLNTIFNMAAASPVLIHSFLRTISGVV